MARKRALMGLRGVGVVVVLGFLLAFHTDVRANKATQIAGESVPGELVEYLERNDVIQIMLNAGLDSRRRLQSASPETVDYYLPWPAGKSLYVIQGNNSSPTHFGKFRYAWDFTQDETGTEKGHPIVAVANGIVRVADYQVGADGYGWGWYVVIEHQEPDGTPKYSLYAHLKVIDPGVQVNQSIRRGEPVGKLGKTGTAALVDVAHLHFQFMDAIWEGDTTARSVPGSFKDIGGDGIPKEGEWYKSQNSPPPGPAPPAQTSTVLVMDVSGSMDWSQPGGGRKIEAAKTAASRFLEMIRAENEVGGPYHQVAVVSFTDEATLDLPLSSDIDHAERVLSLFQPVEGTNMAQALRLAISELQSNERGTKPTIVLLSDGVPTVSLSGETSADIETLKGEVLTIAQEALDNYCIYAVGFGDPNETGRSGGIVVPSLDPEFLTQVASTTDCGQYYSALDGYNLENIYIALRHQSIGTIVGETHGRVSHGETVDAGKVSVEPGQEELGVTLNWSGSMLDLILTDPTGRQVDEDYPGANIFADPRPVYIIIENPMAGDWVISVFGRDVPQVAAEYYVVVSTRQSSTGGPSPFALMFVGILTLGLGSFFFIMLKRPTRMSHKGG